MKKVKTVLCVILAFCFLAVILYSGYQIVLIQNNYRAEAQTHDALIQYKPDGTPSPDQTQPDGQSTDNEITNQSILALQAKYPDALGWLTVPNTKIDYPFAQYTDNDYYLHRDLEGKSLFAGTIFMDCRCEKDFTSQNTILYGHNMKNGSMFGSLSSFNNKTFFQANQYGIIYLPHENLTLEFFAYMVVNPDTEKEVYNVTLSDTYFDYVKQNARYYRDIGLTSEDRIVTLSTCAYEFNNARMVLLARVTKSG